MLREKRLRLLRYAVVVLIALLLLRRKRRLLQISGRKNDGTAPYGANYILAVTPPKLNVADATETEFVQSGSVFVISGEIRGKRLQKTRFACYTVT